MCTVDSKTRNELLRAKKQFRLVAKAARVAQIAQPARPEAVEGSLRNRHREHRSQPEAPAIGDHRLAPFSWF